MTLAAALLGVPDITHVTHINDDHPNLLHQMGGNSAVFLAVLKGKSPLSTSAAPTYKARSIASPPPSPEGTNTLTSGNSPQEKGAAGAVQDLRMDNYKFPDIISLEFFTEW
jgi:hypothetical protein